MDIFGLTYVSSASGIYDAETFRDIALYSGPYNAEHEITGMLLVYNETIVQFLEGPEAEVLSLYDRIENDNRHKNPIVVSTRNYRIREFPEWTMGYQELSDFDGPKYIYSLTPQSLTAHVPQFISATTQALLNGFKRSSGLVAV